MFQPHTQPLTTKPRKEERKDRGQNGGQKWLGAGVTGPRHARRDQEICALSCLPGTLLPSNYPGSDALHQGCSEGPQPCTPTPAPRDRLSRQTEPSQSTTHTACLSHSQKTSGWKKHIDHLNTILSLGLHTNPKYKEPVSVHSDNLKSAQSHNQSHSSSPVNPHILKHTPTASLQAPRCRVTWGVPTHPHKAALVPSGSQVLESHTDTYESHTVSHSFSHIRLVTQPIRTHLHTMHTHAHPHDAPVGLLNPMWTHMTTYIDSPKCTCVSPATHPLPRPEPCAPIHASA